MRQEMYLTCFLGYIWTYIEFQLSVWSFGCNFTVKLTWTLSKNAEICFLTYDVQQVGVFQAPVFVLHHTGVVSFIRRNHRLHDESPHVVSDLKDSRSQ